MRCEGFPFIVGVWGWTCVRFVLLPRRRLVVVSSSSRRGCVVNSLPLGGTFALRHTSYCQSGGSLARNARFGASKSQHFASDAMQSVVFAWQAQHFVMWPFAMSWQGQHFVMWRRCCFYKSHWQGRANVTLFQISWQAQHFVSVLKSGGSFAKVILFELCKNGFIRKTRTKSSIFKLVVLGGFGFVCLFVLFWCGQ